MIKPERIIIPDCRHRIKMEWLWQGFVELKIPTHRSEQLLKKYNPRSNRLGPYVYPICIKYKDRAIDVMLDINTIPKMVFPLVNRTKYYFKIHATADVLKRKNVYPFPNSASSMDYLELLPELRQIKDEKDYTRDFFFVGWHDDDGLRLWTVKAMRAHGARRGWRVRAGCLPFKHHSAVDPKFQIPRMPYQKYLETHARSKLGLALPGGRALPFMSFRHVELMGIGCAVMTRKPTSKPFREKEFNDCCIFYDKKNLVGTVDYYLLHDANRERIAMNARAYYDKYLTPKAHAEYLLETISKKEFGK